jgi:hypothetical protein
MFAGEGLPGMTDVTVYETIHLRSRRFTATADRAAALYVMVTADGRHAKVGFVEAEDHAPARLRAVQHDQMKKKAIAEEGFPLSFGVVAVVDGLVLGSPKHDPEVYLQRIAEVEHLESALRLVLARRLGSFRGWPEWIVTDKPVDAERWVTEVKNAWAKVDELVPYDGTVIDAVGTSRVPEEDVDRWVR